MHCPQTFLPLQLLPRKTSMGHPNSLPIFVTAGELVRLSCRRHPPPIKHHWEYIEGGWDIERPAVMLNGRVQDGTRRLFAASQNRPTMLVPVVEYRSLSEMQLRISGVGKACRTFARPN